MFSVDYLDESVIASCKKQFSHIYPEFTPYVVGATDDKCAIIIEADFPDGTFYFRVTEKSVSCAYKSVAECDK